MNDQARAISPANEFDFQFRRMDKELETALPAHIPVERFMRVVLTAVKSNPDLLAAERMSLFEAAMKAAQDGLLPDGREGAFVVFNTKIKVLNDVGGKVDKWIDKVQWMPMIAGILKKIRNSGELSTICARIVYAGDKYRHWIDDDGEHIFYEAGEDQDRSIIRKVFAMAKLKDGGIEVEELVPAEVEKVRAISRAKDGPAWSGWWDQMAEKVALRRLGKRLPVSTDLDDLIRRDDPLYNFAASQPVDEKGRMTRLFNPMADKESASPPATANQRGGDSGEGAGSETSTPGETGSAPSTKRGRKAKGSNTDTRDGQTDDAKGNESGETEGPSDVKESSEEAPSASEDKSDAALNAPQPSGEAQKEAGAGSSVAPASPSSNAPPSEPQAYCEYARAWMEAETSESVINERWAAERSHRSKMPNITTEMAEELVKFKKARIASIRGETP